MICIPKEGSPVQLQQQQFLEVTVCQSVSSWVGNKSSATNAGEMTKSEIARLLQQLHWLSWT